MLNEPTAPQATIAPRWEPRPAGGASHQARTLNFITWLMLAGATVLGVFDIQFKTWDSVMATLGVAVLCIPALLLNRRGHYRLSASMLSVALLMAITVNLYDGDGVRDPGLLAYAIFIMMGALFFGKKATPYFAVAAALSLAVIVLLEVTGRVHPTLDNTGFDILFPLLTLLAATAGMTWAIVGNLEQNLARAESSEEELARNYDLTLQAWARVLEYRDRETEGHSRRVVELSTRLARRIGMNESDIVHLQRGALLHDIGKLAIPDEILLKQGALDDAERQAIEKHPVYAKQMLAGIPFLERAVSVASSHHERWDGHGYPDGLQGEQIPLEARLFAVVDTWDALGSARVYRAAWPPEEIKAYLKVNAGARFDPRLVDAFLATMGE